MANAPSPFHHHLVEQPRLTDLALAPDGTCLVASVQSQDDKGTRYVDPNHLRLVYETALNFLDHHVLGE